MREIWSNLPAQGQQLFPLLRSTSDLLMMPKDLLLEEGIRADMCSSVSNNARGRGDDSKHKKTYTKLPLLPMLEHALPHLSAQAHHG